MEKELVSFGNYLFKRYGVMEYSNDGKNTPLFERMISDADLCNWRDTLPEDARQFEQLSRYKNGDGVKLCLMPEGNRTNDFPGLTALVRGVHFFSGKVKYDLELRFYGDYSTRIYNVDELFVLPLEENQK